MFFIYKNAGRDLGGQAEARGTELRTGLTGD